ncbi:MAG: sialate O-acetylesterase [Pirellulaceae bacterium]|nr:sialate O-acetylesterase [Pirellulaceae bacterium]
MMKPSFILFALPLFAATSFAFDRPKLQIINGSAQTVDVYWLNPNAERVPNGSVEPGKNTVISTTLGHHFAIVNRGDKSEVLVTSEVPVQAFRVGGVPAFYTQHASAGGFPVVASARVNAYALKEAVHIIDMMLARRPDVRKAMIKSGAQLSILAHYEFTTDQPEWAWLAEEQVPGYEGISTRDYRDARARGMGGSDTDPYCSCAEENLLAYDGDPYSTENILIHEFAHNIHLRGMSNVDASFDTRVKAAYAAAMKAGLWKGKYASVNHHEYFAEGVQSWFDNNRENDHDHNHVNTRAELIDYDPGLAAVCREVFGDTVLKYTKPQTRIAGHLEGYDPSQSPTFVWPKRLEKAHEVIKQKAIARSASKPLKVFILAGQSNMQGHAKIETLDYIGDDPATAPLLDQMRGADGKPQVCEHVWISYLTQQGEGNGEVLGKLTAGFGARRNANADDGKIGPEFTFALTMDAAFDEPVLLIKTAWGGKSLFYDFRPPSAGVYPRTLQDIEKDRNAESDSGHYYRLMVEHVKKVLDEPKRVCPEYDAAQGFEIAGFAWLQGWNDMVNHEVYPELPKGIEGNAYAKYSEWMAAFIRDVRKDFSAPKMPFVIGVLGVGGTKASGHVVAFREAMAAPAVLTEFKGNVVAVETAPFWSDELAAIGDKRGKVSEMARLLRIKHTNYGNKDGTMTDAQQREYMTKFEAELITPAEAALWQRGASNQGYHYLGCAKTFALMGRAFAEAMLQAK